MLSDAGDYEAIASESTGVLRCEILFVVKGVHEYRQPGSRIMGHEVGDRSTSLGPSKALDAGGNASSSGKIPGQCGRRQPAERTAMVLNRSSTSVGTALRLVDSLTCPATIPTKQVPVT